MNQRPRLRDGYVQWVLPLRPPSRRSLLPRPLSCRVASHGSLSPGENWWIIGLVAAFSTKYVLVNARVSARGRRAYSFARLNHTADVSWNTWEVLMTMLMAVEPHILRGFLPPNTWWAGAQFYFGITLSLGGVCSAHKMPLCSFPPPLAGRAQPRRGQWKGSDKNQQSPTMFRHAPVPFFMTWSGKPVDRQDLCSQNRKHTGGWAWDRRARP